MENVKENRADSQFYPNGRILPLVSLPLPNDSTDSARGSLPPAPLPFRSWLPDLISARAAGAPAAPAIVSGTHRLTYGELERRSNQLANRLVALGVSAETVVAVCLDRSIESVLCALAVMKAGGAYLPLDPKQPIDRLTFLLRDAGPRVVITSQDFEGVLAGDAWKTIDVADSSIEKYSIQAPVIKTSPTHQVRPASQKALKLRMQTSRT